MAAQRAALYDSLARYEWMRRRFARACDGENLELHKALGASTQGDRPPPGKSGLHAWIWDRLDAENVSSVLDVGCGFGATILSWARRDDSRAARFVGLGSNPYQIAQARAQAARLGLTARCRFQHQSYDAAIEGRFDRVISVEAIFHSDDLSVTLGNIARSMAPGARLFAVEDVLADAAVPAGARSVHEDPDVERLRTAWSAPRLHTVEDWHETAESVGLTWHGSTDLSDQVVERPEAVLARGERRLRRLRRFAWTRSIRHVADAFIGGLALERLYARGVLRYLAIDLRKIDPHKIDPHKSDPHKVDPRTGDA